MKKRILSFLLVALLLLSVSAVAIAAEEDSVIAIDGAVTVLAKTQAEAGTPVLLFILSAIVENGVDVTVSKVAAIEDATDLASLNADHIAVATALDGGVVEYSCQMSDSLSTGLCHVVMSYLGAAEGCYSIDTFEHVGRNDINALLAALNGDEEEWYDVIDEDINGEFDTDGVTRLTPKEILRKSTADTEYYESLTDKSAFLQIYRQKKGSEDFTTETMVSAFNETVAWIKLRNEANTLDVLNSYNGEGTDKYWNLPLGDTSDFAALGDEQASVLTAMKTGDYTDTDELEADFHNLVLMGMFRNIETREELAALIAETNTDAETGEVIANPYAVDFAGARAILDDASLDEYELIEFLNNVLDGKDYCYTLTDVETLFTNSLPDEEEDDDDKRGGGGGGSSMSASSKPPVYKDNFEYKPVKDIFPFKDVVASHWAKDYIQKLYDKGAINGTSADTFNADGNVYRQDFVKILVGALEMTVSDSASTFSDVPENAYYKTFVMTAYENGLIQGVGDGFGVGTNITRQDAAVILSRVLEKKGIASDTKAESFADDAQISDYAKDAVANVRASGIFGGDSNGNFNPKSYLSRAETCAIICRLAELF